MLSTDDRAYSFVDCLLFLAVSNFYFIMSHSSLWYPVQKGMIAASRTIILIDISLYYEELLFLRSASC